MSLSRILAEAMIALTAAQQQLLRDLSGGHHLKGHRDIEGQKIFRLYHTAANKIVATPALADIEALRSAGLLDSNMKFPAARFFLSPAGRQLAATLANSSPQEPDNG